MSDVQEPSFTPRAVGRNGRRAVRPQRQRGKPLAEPSGAGDGALSAGRRRSTPQRASSTPRSARCWASSSSSKITAGPAAPSAKPWSRRPPPTATPSCMTAPLFRSTARSIPNLPFDYNRDFDAVALVSLVPNILVVTPSVPVNTLADVIAYAKAAPDGIDMASSGNGTLQHHVARSVPLHDRGQGEPRALSRRRPGAQRRHGRAGEVFLRQRIVGGRHDPGRQAQGHRPYRQGPAEEPARRSAGVRHAARLRGL